MWVAAGLHFRQLVTERMIVTSYLKVRSHSGFATSILDQSKDAQAL